MIPIHHINRVDTTTAPQELTSGRSGSIGLFSVTLADNLLKDTMQYEKWRMIRQNDPVKAGNIARLVLERHDYVAGKAPLTEQGRNHFNLLTDRLKNEGIHLYKSHQFNKPIFDENAGSYASVITTAKVHPDSSFSIENSKAPGSERLKYRDCYEFLAGILEENGISYYGGNGVGSALIEQARSRGLNQNAFLTGEGITRLLCENPVEIKVSGAAESTFDELWGKIEPRLKKGAIISFSSQNTGHTGIIDREDGRWVFINSSGSPGNRRTYRVIEEDLKHEIRDRLERAKRQQTFLDITLGSVNRVLTARFENPELTEGTGLKEIDLFQVT
ncbi:MAG: hypothetical protein QG578_347 [Thermodesulfobacteriota bacterium]|nr:hypothetical protein [Thermodesulfobacteriota bacterium]